MYSWARVPLTRGRSTVVDLRDFERLGGYKWYYLNTGYAARSEWGPRRIILMHREILGPHGAHSDHANGDRLDNRRANLRAATPSQNGANQGLRINNTSGYKGVTWQKGAWVAQIKVQRKLHYLGRFQEIEDAASAYNEAAKGYFGEFARA